MSGICGIMRYDSASPSGLGAMTDLLERRGPEGTRHWQDGTCALGHTLLATTPEALTETLPLNLHSCTITADVRLDNREVLIPALSAGDTAGDGELILRAYLRWGEDCVDHLLGDFAFAIWDTREHKLFCARDHLGMKQLIWAETPGKVFAFASEPRSVLTQEDIPERINEGRIADYLEGYLEGINYTETFFEGVSRLPPAHVLVAKNGHLFIRRYWALEPGEELRLVDDREYAEAFLDVLTKSVRRRLRCAGPIGSMLSGGMDSGSVVAVASGLLAKTGQGPLNTFSAVGPNPDDCVETRTILAALAIPSIQPTTVDYSKLGELRPKLLEQIGILDQPFDGNMTLIRSLYLSAQAKGIKVVLDGGAGDLLLNQCSQIEHLFLQRRFWHGVRECWESGKYWGRGSRFHNLFFQGLRRAYTPEWARDFRRYLADKRPKNDKSSGALISDSFAKKIKLSKRRAEFASYNAGRGTTLAEERANGITHPLLICGRERYDRVASNCGIEARDPYMDRDVAELCLRLPGEQFLKNGWPKIVQRRAMLGLLPDSVRWRRGKEHLGWAFTRTLFENSSGWQGRLSTDSVGFTEYVSPAAITQIGKAIDTQKQHIGMSKGLDYEAMTTLFFLVSTLR